MIVIRKALRNISFSYIFTIQLLAFYMMQHGKQNIPCVSFTRVGLQTDNFTMQLLFADQSTSSSAHVTNTDNVEQFRITRIIEETLCGIGIGRSEEHTSELQSR